MHERVVGGGGVYGNGDMLHRGLVRIASSSLMIQNTPIHIMTRALIGKD